MSKSAADFGFSESSPTYGEERNDSASVIDDIGVKLSLVLPPPPPAVFLGYTLPPGHPCHSFALPPPPADKKRTGPRRKYSTIFCISCGFRFREAYYLLGEVC